MKKLFTLLAFMCVVVLSSQAENVTRRFVVEIQGDLATSWTGWKDTPKIYIYYKDANNSDQVLTDSWPGAELTSLATYSADNQRHVYYYDLTADESVFSSIYVIINRGSGWSNGDDHQDWDQVGYNALDYSANDHIFYVYNNSENNNKPALSAQPITYYLVDTAGKEKASLTFNASTEDLSGTYSNAEETYCILAPSYALWDNFSGIRSWDMVYRPEGSSDYVIGNFVNYVGKLTGSKKVFKFSLNSEFDLTFNPINRTFTVSPYFERTLPEAAEGYATFSSDKAVAIPGDITAVMYPSAVSPTGAITWKKFENGIPAGQGALLEGTKGKTYKFTPVENPDVVSGDGNITMEPIDADVAKNPLQQTDTNGYTNYILWKSSNVLGFFKVNYSGTWVNEGTAYLKVKLPKEDSSDPSDTGGAPAFFPLTGETTAIDNLTTEPAQKGEEKIYSLDGRRIVGQPTAKGIYIVNGKKLLKK